MSVTHVIQAEESKDIPLPASFVVQAIDHDLAPMGFDATCFDTTAVLPKVTIYTNQSRALSAERYDFFMLLARTVSGEWYRWTGSKLVDICDENGLVYLIEESGDFLCKIHEEGAPILN